MVTRASLIKPTKNTKFHIDFDWWKSQDRNWRNSLITFFCPQHAETFAEHVDTPEMDLVDPETGEVSQGDALIFTLIHHCAKQDEFITTNAPLVDTVFKVFLSNNNQPLNSEELSEIIHRPANTILSTIGANRVYKGIRPV